MAAESGGQGSDRLLAPPWVGAIAAAAIAAMPVWFFDELEGTAGRFGIDGGHLAFLFPLGAFVLAWIAAGAVLALAPAPAREGLVAGALVALLMAGIFIRIALGHGAFVLILLIGFGGLAVGLGAAAGAMAAAFRRRRGGMRAAATAAILCGILLLAFWLLPIWSAGGANLFIVAVAVPLAALLIAGGIWVLQRSGPKAQ